LQQGINAHLVYVGIGPLRWGRIGSVFGHAESVGDARREHKQGDLRSGLRQTLCILPELCYVPCRSAAPKSSRTTAHKGWVMDYFFFFAGLLATIAGLLTIKVTSKNQH